MAVGRVAASAQRRLHRTREATQRRLRRPRVPATGTGSGSGLARSRSPKPRACLEVELRADPRVPRRLNRRRRQPRRRRPRTPGCSRSPRPCSSGCRGRARPASASGRTGGSFATRKSMLFRRSAKIVNGSIRFTVTLAAPERFRPSGCGPAAIHALVADEVRRQRGPGDARPRPAHLDVHLRESYRSRAP